MPVMVEQVVPTKSGKGWRVLLGGTWYNSFKDSGINLQVGKYIEAEIQTHEKFGPTITAWKPCVATGYTTPFSKEVATMMPQPVVPGAAATQSGASTTYDERNPPPSVYEREPQYAKPSDNVAPWFWPSVSNICSSAIEKGLVQHPQQLNDWALVWAQVCVAVKEQVK